MACFLLPLSLAVILSIVQRLVRGLASRIRLGLLNAMLWGGAILLIIEHLWHGEVVPWPPFLTAMSNPSEIPVMIHEISVTGSTMTASIVGIWSLILLTQSTYIRNIKSKVLGKTLAVKPK